MAVPPAPPRPIVLAAVGDVMLGGTAGPEMQKYGFDYPFEAVREHLRGADIVIGNLEGPLTHGGEPTDKRYVFRSPPEKVAPALARAGFNVVSLANNHVLDYGEIGLTDTMKALDEAGIHHSGAGKNLEEARRAATLDIHGIRFAFLAYSFTFPEEFWATPDRAGTAFGHEASILADVAAAKRAADVVIVSFHWGQEAATELRPYQTQIGRAAIGAGAAVVIGHHPHVLQAVEKYGDGVILYSLGNFAFGSFSQTARTSAIAMLQFEGPRLASLTLIPLNVLNEEVIFQPRPLTGPAADAVVAHLQELSSPMGTVLENDHGTARLRW
ncbi:MAG TPA: CapA family protein [Nitrospiria bacterium]